MTNSQTPCMSRRLRPLPVMPPPEILESGVAILPGGNDTLNLPLIIFPTELHPAFLSMTPSKVVQLLKYYISITKAGMRLNGFAFLADLRTSSVQMFQILVQSMEMLQKENRGSVAVFYCIQPRGKEAVKLLKRLLGIKDKKKRLKNPFKKPSYDMQRGALENAFKSVLFEDLPQLYRYIERRQLTVDFNGSLIYHHASWIAFRKELEELYHHIDVVFEKLPQYESTLNNLMEHEIPIAEDELEQEIADMKEKYRQILRELNIDFAIEKCKIVIDKCKAPRQYDIYRDLDPNPIITETLGMAEKHQQRLIATRDELKGKWLKAEERLQKQCNVRSHKEKAHQVLTWIEEVGKLKFREPIGTVENASQAETVKNHFDAGFHALAKEVLFEADEVKETMDRLTLERDSQQVEANAEFARNFENKVHEFRVALERRARMYQDMYHFFLLTGKMTRWYRRTLSFLPSKYLSYYLDYGHDEMLPLSEEWNAEVNKYLYKHPAPRKDHIDKVRQGIPTVQNMRGRNQARLLIHRVSLLRSLLVDGQIVVSDYRQLLRHKEKATRGLDELDTNTSRSLPDLSRPLGGEDPALVSRFTHTHDPSHRRQYDVIPRDGVPVRKASSYHNLMASTDRDGSFDYIDVTDDRRPRARSEFSVPTSGLRKFRSQPDVMGLPMGAPVDASAHTNRTMKRRPRQSNTPGKRYTKARQHRSSRTPTDSDNTDLTYPTKKRNFSFHRQPPERQLYGVYGESDMESLPSHRSSDSYSGVRRPLSLPCTPPPLTVQTDFEHVQTLPASFRTSKRNPLYSSLPDLLLKDLQSPLSLTEQNLDSVNYRNLTPAEKMDIMMESRRNPLYSSQPELTRRHAPVPPRLRAPAPPSYRMPQPAYRRLAPSPPAYKHISASQLMEPVPPAYNKRAASPLIEPRPPAFDMSRLTEEERELIRDVLEEKEALEEPAAFTRTTNNPLYYAAADDELSETATITEDGLSTDEDIRMINEALRKRRLEELKKRKNNLLHNGFVADDLLSYLYNDHPQTTADKRASRESGVYGNSDSDYSGSDSQLDLSAGDNLTRRHYRNYPGHRYVTRQTAPLDNDDEADLTDLHQLEVLEETLKRHTYNERKTLISQSRDRMLQDLINLDEMEHGKVLTKSQPVNDAFYY